MRRPAMQSILLQDAYPSQAEGGLAGDVSRQLKAALKAWDQRRYDGGNGFRYGKGNGLYKKAKVTNRSEVTWNPAPKKKATIKVPRTVVQKPKKRAKTEAEKQSINDARRDKNRSRQQARRAKETECQRLARLEARRAEYVAKHGPLKNPWTKRPGVALTPEQKEARRQRVAAYSAAWRARMTPEEKAKYNRAKAAKKRKK